MISNHRTYLFGFVIGYSLKFSLVAGILNANSL